MQAAELTALSRELLDFLVELSISTHKHAIYPDGHPLLAATARGLARRVSALLIERPMLAFGVARSQLVVDGIATDPNHSLLCDLALRLHRREIGAVKFTRGVEEDEVAAMLRVIGRENNRPEHPRPTEVSEALPVWPHVRLFPLSYDQLSLLGDEEERPGAQGAPGAPGVALSWAMQLWLGLARAAVAQEASPDAKAPTDPLVIANAIETRARNATYERAIASHLAQLAEEMRIRGGSDSAALRKRVRQLIGALSPETLCRLLEAAGSGAERRKFMIDASHAMAVDTVLDLASAAAHSSQRSISQGLLRLLSKLARHAEEGSDYAKGLADWALRENVRHLIAGWDDDVPEPGSAAYWETLGELVRERAVTSQPVASRHPIEPERVVQMALEMDVLSVAVREAVDALIEQGRVGVLLDLVDRSLDANEVVRTLREHLDTPSTVQQLLRHEPVDFEVLYCLVGRVGIPAVEPLLDGLEATSDRTTRWKIFELLVQFGEELGPAIVSRLPNAPWYMQRNILSLIARLPSWPPGFTPAVLAKHDDERVRREAVKLLLAEAGTRDQAICDGLADSDERIARLALSAAIEHCPTAAIPALVRRVEAVEDDPQLRVLAVRALGASRSPTARDCLVRACVATKGRWFRKQKLAPKSPLLLASLQALAAGWHDDQRGAAVLALAARSADPEIKTAGATPGAVA
ncbi:MAG TPA: HEAT repeat domain-containing protein [Gemmatimonadaceae bacterium]|nr:HEAT repeat domain-containing protein [Gemmatimonadaceae bacterium]